MTLDLKIAAVAGCDRTIEFSFEASVAVKQLPQLRPSEEAPKTETDPFDEIDFGSFFDDYLDPGFKSPASESVEKPSFETFLSSPVTLSDHLQSQLSVSDLAGSCTARQRTPSSAIWKTAAI